MTTPVVTLAAEGVTDFAILRRLVREARLEPGNEYGGVGKSRIDERILSYNNAAKYAPWVVTRDMDRDAECAAALINKLLPKPAKLMRFRIVVRASEAWLLSDRERFSEAFNVSLKNVPEKPETIENPKSHMLEALAKSTLKDVRERAVRQDDSGSKEPGPEYNSTLSVFAESHWRPDVAAKTAESLARARKRLCELAKLLG